MSLEIERKFLVKNHSWRAEAVRSVTIRQNYLSGKPAVRVRLADGRGFLTVKGRVEGTRISRLEYEYEIPPSDAEEMLKFLCRGYEISKICYLVPFAGKTWEVDEFSGWNEGLFLAELELEQENESFVFPPWLGREVTGNPAYSNSALAVTPWKRRTKPEAEVPFPE